MDMKEKKAKEEGGQRSKPNEDNQEESLIRLDDLLPKRNVTGGRKKFFGSSDIQAGRTRSRKKGR